MHSYVILYDQALFVVQPSGFRRMSIQIKQASRASANKLLLTLVLWSGSQPINAHLQILSYVSLLLWGYFCSPTTPLFQDKRRTIASQLLDS